MLIINLLYAYYMFVMSYIIRLKFHTFTTSDILVYSNYTMLLYELLSPI